MSSEQNLKHVGILFGGRSAEHEVSVASAKNVVAALDRKQFAPVPVGIDQKGRWHAGDADEPLEATLTNKTIVTLAPGNPRRELINVQTGAAVAALDVAFPVLHGPYGEDGSVQGLLELASVPYVGAGVLGSAVGMDKDVMKRLLRDADIAVTPFAVVRTEELETFRPAEVIAKLGLPLFVKPANMGSSVGVSKITEASALRPAIHEALKFDTKVLVEAAVGGEEIECAVLGGKQPAVSAVGKIIPAAGGFYSYEAKYLDEHGAALQIPAQLSPEVAAQAKTIALQTFQTLECAGLARIDMFATADGRVLVNEINTLPGFTDISMYPKLWEASGLAPQQLLTRLIALALERFVARALLQTTRQQ